MHVLILGAGVVGVSTAYVLAEAGARVTVVDRRLGPAQETSAANGGHLSASQARPWATPAVPGQLVRWLGRADAPLRLPLRWDPALWRWGLRYLGNCRPRAYRANAEAVLRLARYSQGVMRCFLRESGVEFDHRPEGLLAIYRSGASLDAAHADVRWLTDAGLVDDELLDAGECLRAEPALAAAQDNGTLAGGILSRDGATGDAARFTAGIAKACANLEVAFRYGVEVQGIDRVKGRVTGVRTNAGTILADATVVALANDSRTLLAADLGIDLPLCPVKGYSVTLPATSAESRLPRMGILDDDRKVVFARFADSFRAAGTAEFAGIDTTIDNRRVKSILSAAASLFPGPLDRVQPAAAGAWTGLRPMTPDGPPILGPAKGISGLFFNTGHGPLGWTLAAGSARMLADWIAGSAPALDAAPYSAERFRQN